MAERIRKVLVANRGEIARRVMRTCRAMGIDTVAVFSDADADMPFVREADEAVRIGPAPSAESYLVIDSIVDAAKKTGAGAVHPGYGFLAENAAFAEACESAGVTFIGPTPEAIRAMGSKKEAKHIAREAGVSVVPGYDGERQDAATLAAEAKRVGFPVLLKASAGGGGKGMQVVRDEKDLAGAIESARRVAESAFGDGTLLIEKYVEQPRHVEIQILGDAHGNLVHLYERECSIQRRHQKIVEETPSPVLDAALRARMGEAAVKVGRAIGYRNAGTVEFILAPDGSFYFLEVNTRLQVEHPVTECVTGLDLVREQIRVAEGAPLPFAQEDVRFEGAAVEVRIYAEDPAKDFLPQAGRVVEWHLPPMPGLRVDGGVESGSEVSVHYDPMLAKIITSAPTRDEAVDRMVRALRSLSVQGITTNRDFLLHVLEHPEFRAGRFDTHFIETHLGDARAAAVDEVLVQRAAIAATLAGHERRRAEAPEPRVSSGFRLSHFQRQWVEYEGPAGDLRVEYRHHGGGRFVVGVGGEDRTVRLVAFDGRELIFEDGDGVRRRLRVVWDGARTFVHCLDGAVALTEKPRFPDRARAAVAGGCVAPMPGKVTKLEVAEGDTVQAGQVLLVMEAMKMEHNVQAPEDGVVRELLVAEGEQVDADQLLAVVSAAE